MRSSFALLVCAATLCAVPSTLEAQEGRVSGRVLSEDGRPLGGAIISITGTGLGSLTNPQGRFLILRVPAGPRTVRVESMGFATVEGSVTVEAGATAIINFQVGADAVVLDEVTVTVGSRAAHTTADELAVAVDVYPEAQIVGTAQVEMAAVLNELSPSIYFPRRQISDITSGVRPFQLRGLAPDHALVLINGKRRHPTAVVNVFGGGAFAGSSGVDMNAFPTMAMGRMDVLRDGAAAQYGSDAIAGVINLGLKSNVSDPVVSVSLGQTFPSEWDNDGERVDVSGNWGIPLGRGSLNLTAAFSDRNKTNRAGADARDQQAEGDADVVVDGKVVTKNNPVPQPNHLWGDGEATNRMLFWNLEMPISDTDDAAEFYLFGGFSKRQDVHSGFYRRAMDNRNWPQIYPLGFLPTFDTDTRDISVIAGVEGIANEWNWDISGQYGSNRVDNDIKNTHNASLGPCLDTPCAPGRDGILGTADDPGIPNATRFYAGSLEMNQLLANADISRRFEVGLPSPLTIAFGASFRSDNYKVIEGEPGSYLNGFHPNQSGGIASSGSQVFAGYRPEQSQDDTRTNFGLYAETEVNVTDRILTSVAARFENYSDFGSTVTGKAAVRLEATENFILRGAASTGFRAPSQSQSFYGHVSTNFRTDPNDPNNQIGFEVGEFPVNSPEALAVGSEPLYEETSRSLSAGIALTPTNNWNITIDGYLVDVDDAIVMSGTLSSDFVQSLLTNFAAESIRFFANAIDLRAKGLDVTSNYRYYFGQQRLIEAIVSWNFNDNKVRHVRERNAVLTANDFSIYDEDDITSFEDGTPKERGIVNLRYTQGPVRVGASLNHYGEQLERISVDPDDFRVLEAKNSLDLDATWEATEDLAITIGAENVFDTFPTRFDTFGGIFTYRTGSGMGFNGRYLYTRVRATIPF